MAGINGFNWQPNAYGQSVTPINQHQAQSSLIWVDGEQGASMYPVARGNTILLLDSQSSMFYLKSMDLTGVVNLRKFKFDEILNEETTKEENPEFTITDVINKLDSSLDGLYSRLDELQNMHSKFEQDTIDQMRFMEDKLNRLSYNKKKHDKENDK